jgi:hypothetical protein
MSLIRKISQFFTNIDDEQIDVTTQTPLPVSDGIVCANDIWVSQSVMNNFSGDVTDLFDNLHTVNTDNTSNNPKEMLIHFENPIISNLIAIGAFVGASGQFSNLEIQAARSDGVFTTIVDESADSTIKQTEDYPLPVTVGYNAIKLRFHTTNTITISNLVIPTTKAVVARMQGVDQDNMVRNIRATEVGNLMTSDFLVEVSRGNIPGYSLDRKFGSIGSIQTSTPADVWSYGITSGAETYTFSTTADIDRVSSDNSGDTGISITVVGLDSNWLEVTQTVALDGTDAQTPVALTTPLIRVNRAFNANGTDLLGNVYVFVNGATTGGVPNTVTDVRAFILIGEGQTLQTIYTVPDGKTAYFMGLESSLTKAGGATIVSGTFRGRTREFGKVFRTKDEFELISHGGSNRSYNQPIPLPFIERTDFVANVSVTAHGTGATWAFTVLLIDN